MSVAEELLSTAPCLVHSAMKTIWLAQRALSRSCYLLCLGVSQTNLFHFSFFDLQVLGTAAGEPHGTYGFSGQLHQRVLAEAGL